MIDNNDGSIYHIDFKEEDETEDSDDSDQLPSETVKKPGSFKAWCKSQGLLSEDGDVGDKCISAGLKSKNKSIQAKAKLARAFKTMRKQKKAKSDFVEDITFDAFIEHIDSEDFDIMNHNLEEIINKAIKNKTKKEKGECDMDFEMKETSETKPDGSEAMKERRITQCIEETGKSREACTEEVRKKMHEKGAEAVDPTDMKEEPKEEAPKEEIKEEPIEEKDTIEVCKKEYDFLKNQAEELKKLKEEKEKAENELESFKSDFLKFKKKIDEREAAEKEAERVEVLQRIAHDFDIPEEELEKDTIEELKKLENRLELALRRDTEEEEVFEDEEDMKKIVDDIEKRYFLEV